MGLRFANRGGYNAITVRRGRSFDIRRALRHGGRVARSRVAKGNGFWLDLIHEEVRMRRIVWTVFALLLVVAMVLSGCQVEVADGEEEAFRVGLVTDVGTVSDRSFNQAAWMAVQQAERELGAEVNYIETSAVTDYEDNIRQFADAGYDVIVTVGFALADTTIEMAAEYPDIYFIGVDQFQPEPIPNLAGVIFEEDKAGYLAGVVAANLTKTGIIAGVFGTDLIPPVVAYKEGFEAGARAENPDIEILSTYHPGDISTAFTDPEWGAATAAQAIDRGADVVFAAAGLTGNGALEETATHEGLYCIGVDIDQWETVPGARPCLVTSALKEITPAVYDLIVAAKEGTFQGGNAIGDTGLAPFHDFEDQIPDELKQKLEDIKQGLQDGTITTGYGG